MKITLKQDFTETEEIYTRLLLKELMESCHELEEFSTVQVYGLKEDEGNFSILFEIDVSKPEGKNTLFGNY